MIAYLFSNKDYMSMIISGRLDRQKMLSVLSDMPEWIMIVMLFAEILLTLIVMLYCKVFERRKLSTLGFVKKGMVKQYIAGLVAGAAAFSAVYIICVVTGSVKCEGISQNIMPLYIIGYFLGYLLQGMAAVDILWCRCQEDTMLHLLLLQVRCFLHFYIQVTTGCHHLHI